MSDFPNLNTTPPFIHTWSRYAAQWNARVAVGGGVPASINWVSGVITYVPVKIPFCYTVRRVFWGNGSVAGSFAAAVGIYTEDGVALYRSPSTTTSGTSAPQYVTLSTPLMLCPGSYYFAYGGSGTVTNRSWGLNATLTTNMLRMVGCEEQTGITFTNGQTNLPATATFASTPANVLMALFGVTRTT